MHGIQNTQQYRAQNTQQYRAGHAEHSPIQYKRPQTNTALTQELLGVSEGQVGPVVSHAHEKGLVVHGAVLQELDGEVRVLDVRQRTARHPLHVHRTHGVVVQLAVRSRTDL